MWITNKFYFLIQTLSFLYSCTFYGQWYIVYYLMNINDIFRIEQIIASNILLYFLFKYIVKIQLLYKMLVK